MDEQTEPWGIQVSKVIVKDVELPEELKRDMARRAQSERESRRASGSA
jgi:regulator of protease activity HflC (stomatin/prohibitin superfamily)